MPLNILKMHLQPRLCPGPAGEAYSAPPHTLAGFWGVKGKGGEEGERERRGEEGKGQGLSPPQNSRPGFATGCAW